MKILLVIIILTLLVGSLWLFWPITKNRTTYNCRPQFGFRMAKEGEPMFATPEDGSEPTGADFLLYHEKSYPHGCDETKRKYDETNLQFVMRVLFKAKEDTQ